jgi:DNA polymerase-3 subunit epsilon
MRIVAIDFETANYSELSICSVGIALFENNQLADTFYSLIRPPKGYGRFRTDWITDCHGISPTDVCNAAEFPAIAPEIFTRLSAADVVVAHNAKFDMRVLRITSAHFNLPCPAFDYLCTLALSRRIWPGLKGYSLDVVAAHIGHRFDHHQAQSDAETAGRILLAMMIQNGISTPRDLAAAVGVPLGRLDVAGEKLA